MQRKTTVSFVLKSNKPQKVVIIIGRMLMKIHMYNYVHDNFSIFGLDFLNQILRKHKAFLSTLMVQNLEFRIFVCISKININEK